MTNYIRKCPGCKEERSEAEALCGKCAWDLTLEPLRLPGQLDDIHNTPISDLITTRYCLNGHSIDPDDTMCFECGTTEVGLEEGIKQPPLLNEFVIDGWHVINQLLSHSDSFETFLVERHNHRAILTLYHPNTKPDSSIYKVLERLPKNYVPELLTYGKWNERSYDVTDCTHQSNFLELSSTKPDLEMIQKLVKSIGRILAALTENKLCHGNLRPESILISHKDPLKVMLTGFQFSHLFKFDLETILRPTSAMYTAPEVIAGGISVASDWWSLGMIILQLITNNRCFEEINEKAFRIHVVTRGISLPKAIDPALNLLLRGLLARDPGQRWQWPEIQIWLSGDPVEAPSDMNDEAVRKGPLLEFKGLSYSCPKAYAIAASESSNCEQAKNLFMRGVISTWLADRKSDPKLIVGVRLIASIESIPEDFRHALTLMRMNADLPLIYQGEIITSAWLLQHPIQGYDLIAGPFTEHLRQIKREHLLCSLSDRMKRAREKAKKLEIELSEESFRILALASSLQNLEQQWEIHRRLYPGSDHSSLNSLMDKHPITDEDLIIMLGANLQQYQSTEQLLNQAKTVALQAGIRSYEITAAQHWISVSKRDLYREIEKRIENYARCGIARVDEWANDFRVARRIALPRALALLSVYTESWKEPPQQQYISSILELFEKRAALLAQKSALARMLINKSNARVDLATVAGKKPDASSILGHIISRVEMSIGIDRMAFENGSDLEKRLRHLVSHAQTYKRDTGIDSLYLGFPFLIMQDSGLETIAKKPRIAPILLWPIKIDLGQKDKISIIFDCDREDVLLNKALDSLIGAEEAKRWGQAAKDLLEKSTLHPEDVVNSFSTFVDLREISLCALPGSDYQVKAGVKQIVYSAVFFHVEFMGQALGADLSQLRKEPLTGTALETALRINKDLVSSPQPSLTPEKDRYFTIESDPSQEKAVLLARQSPGILIEGPPGTGKSQTIVNIIGDCIGRKQTVLIVCQKSTALEVLEKRLNAEGLQDRFFYITHVNKDKTSVIKNLRAQLENMNQSLRSYRSGNIERDRDELAEKIERLESDIDKYHRSLHVTDDATGLSYRTLLGQLIDLEDHRIKRMEMPEFRGLLMDLNPKQLNTIEETCAPLAKIWLGSLFEESPLANLNQFSSDTTLTNEFTDSLFSFVDIEKKRELINQRSIAFEIEDPVPHQEWIQTHDRLLRKMNWQNISSWFSLFTKNKQSKGGDLLNQLRGLQKSIIELSLEIHDPQLLSKLIETPRSTLKRWLALANSTVLPPSFFTRLNPWIFLKHYWIRKILLKFGETDTPEKIQQFQKATACALQQLQTHDATIKILAKIYQEPKLSNSFYLKELKFILDQVIRELTLAQNGILALDTCPRQDEINSIVKEGLPSYLKLFENYEKAFAHHQAKVDSLDALESLSTFFYENFSSTCRVNIIDKISNLALLQPIIKALPSLSDYQEFRLQTRDISPKILKIFAILRKKNNELRQYASDELEGVMRRLLAREARLAWKERIEQQLPILRLEQKELSRKIQALAECNEQMKRMNQKFLALNITADKVKDAQDWDQITRLRGPRACRLREIMERGLDMGLMTLRPIWLMNPDTASQLLPLRASLFDLVIFDEASQIPIENALPALYRAKRAVISGDEKQMPPTTFFMKRQQDDDDEDDLDNKDLDEMLSDSELEAREDSWNRQEIKDCPDLLALGKIVLPKSMLQIHYRSKYRELIAFSNAAFYGNQLSVPVRHPESVIQAIRPIEVIRVDGLYSHQTNRQEAEKVVDLLAKQWKSSERPSIGVVTFNAKQADLIEDVLAERADNDPALQEALTQERSRLQYGENMSFFVKNLENVQGDERDMIIFSSTFGRDEKGSFRRQFGLLGQIGGECRLNVAMTRAREKIILVTSLPINEISDALSKRQAPKNSRDYLQAYFDYATKISDGSLEMARRSLDSMTAESHKAQMPSSFDKDGFTRSVSSFIKSLGLTLSDIKENDAFGLDFVIEDIDKKRFGVGIECDAHCHPILETARAREVWRPKVLLMAIPHLYRVTSYAWYHRRQEEMDRLTQALEKALGLTLNTSTHHNKYKEIEE